MIVRTCLSSIIGTLIFSSITRTAEPKEPKKEPSKEWTGKIVLLAKALEKLDASPDADSGIVLVTPDGKIWTLVKDNVTRFLFLDKRLHGRTRTVSIRLCDKKERNYFG